MRPEAWPPLVSGQRPTDYLKVGLFVAFQLVLFLGLLISSAVRWASALIIISYVVVSAFKGYDHLELTLHGPQTLHNQVAPTAHSLGAARGVSSNDDAIKSSKEPSAKSKSE